MIFLKQKKNIYKKVSLITVILGTGIILLSTGCEVQQVGSVKYEDFTIAPATGPIIPGNCADGLDNDGNGLTDNNDPANCGPGASGEILPPLPANCADGDDNDEDTFVDEADPDCARYNAAGIAWVLLCDPTSTLYDSTACSDDAPTGEQVPPPINYLANCADGDDNDENGSCDLFGCTVNGVTLLPDTANCGYYDLTVGMVFTSGSTGEFAPAEAQVLANCADGQDNDGDGDTDLDDDDCNPDIEGSNGEFAVQIPPPPFSCYDGQDNDGDGDTDGDDSDCVYDAVTGQYGEGGGEINELPAIGLSLPVNCADGLDNDGDGDTDTDDADCELGVGTGELTPPTPVNCDDGVDNDGDDLVDAEDTESCGIGGSGELQPVPPPPTPPTLDDPIVPPPIVLQPAVNTEGTEEATELAGTLDELPVEDLPVIDVPDVEEDYAAAETAADSIFLASNAVLGEGADVAVTATLDAVEEAVAIPPDPTPEQVEDAANEFANDIQTQIENGEDLDIGTVTEEDVQAVLELVAEDTVLGFLLAQFMGDQTVLNNTLLLPTDIEFLGKTMDYEACVVGCGELSQSCNDEVADLLAECQGDCMSPYNLNYAECIAQDSTLLGDCTQDAQDAYNNCAGGLEDTQDACEDDALETRNSCTSSFGTNEEYLISCGGEAQTVLDACNDVIEDQIADCVEPINGIFTQCETENNTAHGLCTGAADAAYGICIGAAVADTSLCLDPVQTTLDECELLVDNTRTTCDDNLADTLGVCYTDGDLALETNLNEAATQFTNMMEEAVAMSATCDPGGDPLLDGPLCPYGDILESLSLTLFMNQCFIADLNYQADDAQCTTDSTLNAYECALAEGEGDSDCQNTISPGFDACVATYGANTGACEGQQNTEIGFCNAAQSAQLTNCTEDQADNTDECNITYGTNNYQLCLDSYTASTEGCQTYYDDVTGDCFDAYDTEFLVCQANFDGNVTSCPDIDAETAVCDTSSLERIESCNNDLAVGDAECGSGCDIPNPCPDNYQLCTEACHNAELGE